MNNGATLARLTAHPTQFLLTHRDGGFTSPISKRSGVTAIPHTFTIDAEGALQDEHIGDASIEGKLKKLLAQARELQPQSQPAETAAAK